MSILLLLEKADKSGLAIRIERPGISLGESQKLKPSIDITVSPDEDNLLNFISVGVMQACYLMFRENLMRRVLSARFNLENMPDNIKGSSADLAFALATITHTLPIDKDYPPIAATGTLDKKGFVGSVEAIPAKLQAGLSAIEPGGIIFFPDANKPDVTEEIERLAEKKGVKLCPVKRIDEAVSILGHPINKVEPYIGLRPYTYDCNPIFFGRDQEIIDICDKLKTNAKQNTPGLIIVAASGAGKSSLVQAGVLPALVQMGINPAKPEKDIEEKEPPIIWAVSRPTEFVNLSNEVESCTAIKKAWKHQCSPELLNLPEVDSWEQLGAELTKALPENHRFVWVLDQLEELFTLEQLESISTEGYLNRFVEFLSQLQKNGVWLIATLRNDYYSQYQAVPKLLTIFRDKQYDLLNGKSSMLSEIINEPAVLAELDFGFADDDEATGRKKHIQLNDQIFEDMKGTTQGLPFLSLTLQLLFEKSENNRLTFKAYEEIGGLQGAIKTHIHQIVSNLVTSKRKLVSEAQLLDILEKLVGLNAKGNRTFRISTPLTAFTQEEQFIARQLIDVRLLTTRDKNNQTLVELALDCLLEEWPEVISAIKRRKEEFQARQRLIDDAEYWNAMGQDKELLINNFEKVVEAELQLHHERHYFSSVIESYVENSMLKTRKKLRGV